MTEPFVDNFVEPRTVDEALARRAELSARAQHIQAQLAGRNRVVDGRRLVAHAYHEWRARAVMALSSTQAEMGLLRAWLARSRTSRAPSRTPGRGTGRSPARAATLRLIRYVDALYDRIEELEAQVDALGRDLGRRGGDPAAILIALQEAQDADRDDQADAVCPLRGATP